jgi:hypothetical protein
MRASSSAMSTRRAAAIVTPTSLSIEILSVRVTTLCRGMPRYPNGRGDGFKTHTVSVQIRLGAPNSAIWRSHATIHGVASPYRRGCGQGQRTVGSDGDPRWMHDLTLRAEAVAALRAGSSFRAVSTQSGLSRATLRSWLVQPEPKTSRLPCPICSPAAFVSTNHYGYLLGMYLGDGCISRAARTTSLRITCDNGWPGVMNQCEVAIAAVSGRPVYRVSKPGCTDLASLWKHWPCLFPQHGPGRKHERRIALEGWQREAVEADPRPLIRGLIHSDGCRAMNTVHRQLPSGSRTYSYPRYFFSNMSDDIQRIFTDALDQLGIAWKQNRFNSISVAKRTSVAALDEFVGPKS